MTPSSLLELRKFVAPEFVFGPGAYRLVGRYAGNFGARRVLVVTDPGLVEVGCTSRVCESLAAAGVKTVVFDRVSPNPREDEVMAGVEVFRAEQCDAIVAVGGGSPMDCAKGIGVAHTNDRHVLEFEGADKIPMPAPPLICIPTTAGTSADVSQFAIITDQKRKVKIAIVSKTAVPDAALIDPELTVTMPPHLTACTGLDALTHAVEAYVSTASSPVTDLFALEAIQLIKAWLLRAIESPKDLEARSWMMLASLDAGLAFSNAILGAVHAMAHSLGGFLDLAHGACNAILLPEVMAFNYPACPERYEAIGQALGVNIAGLGQEDRQAATIQAVRDLKRAAGVTQTLGQLGVTRSALPELASKALQDPCMLTNPRRPTGEEVVAIYEDAL